MIPKIIHYCWLSCDSYPEKIQYCISTWKKKLPDYDIVLWDTNKFPMNHSQWVKEAFEQKKYAFAADYIRLYAVYNYGGIYLDSDIEVIKSFNDLLDLPYFVGYEAFDGRVECAAFGAEKGIPWIKECLDYYENRHFIKENGEFDQEVMPSVVYKVTSKKYKIKSIKNIDEFESNSKTLNILPVDWFCARKFSQTNKTNDSYVISPNSYCVHHFAHSWIKVNKLKLFIKNILLKFGLYKPHK